MKITIFTSNQARHISLINQLADVCESCFAIIESNTIYPGLNKDFYDNTDLFKKYFSQVLDAENSIFGKPSFINKKVRSLVIRPSDLNKINKDLLSPSLESDLFIVFGSSYIKGWLIDFLIENNAINIHMGVSPFYRGSSCNFWALYDNRPEYVGGTVHKLSKGLDSGDILYHALPSLKNSKNPFEFTMNSVSAVHKSLISYVKNGNILKLKTTKQDSKLLVRYSRYVDFNDESILDFYSKNINMKNISQNLKSKRMSKKYIQPYIPD